jgi:hypothetical protein
MPALLLKIPTSFPFPSSRHTRILAICLLTAMWPLCGLIDNFCAGWISPPEGFGCLTALMMYLDYARGSAIYFACLLAISIAALLWSIQDWERRKFQALIFAILISTCIGLCCQVGLLGPIRTPYVLATFLSFWLLGSCSKSILKD